MIDYYLLLVVTLDLKSALLPVQSTKHKSKHFFFFRYIILHSSRSSCLWKSHFNIHATEDVVLFFEF